MASEITLEEAKRRIRELIEENRTLGETLHETQAQVASVEKAAKTALQARDKAEKQAEQALKSAEEQQKLAAELRAANRQLTAQAKRLTKQVEKTKLHPLTPEEASGLLQQTLQTFQEGTSFEVREVNLTLKLATAGLGDQPVLVLPEPGAMEAAALHELKISLRGPGGLAEAKPGSLKPPVP